MKIAETRLDHEFPDNAVLVRNKDGILKRVNSAASRLARGTEKKAATPSNDMGLWLQEQLKEVGVEMEQLQKLYAALSTVLALVIKRRA